jgi:MOSC domain-containing protein YiiM
MAEGTVVHIFVAKAAREPLESIAEVHAVPGKGLEGDRYFSGVGTFWKPLPDRDVTLIEVEALEKLERETGVRLEPRDSRRNVVTRGVDLNGLVGREFSVGACRLRGIRLCEPCDHLEAVTGKSVIAGLTHRGGLRAQILTEGVIHVGDPVGANGLP